MVPVTACGSDLGLMLGGRLTDMGRSPADVRAFVDSGEEELEGAHHSLRDAQRTIEQRT